MLILSKKKLAVMFIIGIISGMFIISPILSFLGVPTFNDILTNIFDEKNPLALVISILVICLIIISIYKKN